MKLIHEGLTLWYDTPDAPAPPSSNAAREGSYIEIGVSPCSLSNQVQVQYCVDNGTVQVLFAILIKTDYAQKKQYFRATFPHFYSGDRVSYQVILTCSGRQVPDAKTASCLKNSFCLATRTIPNHSETFNSEEVNLIAANSLQVGKFPVHLDYLARVIVQLQKPPEMIGETPEGLKVNWYLKGGRVTGPKLNAIVRSEGGDWMTLRPDGIGILGIHATLETPDGALIYTHYSGVFELGEDGYRKFLNQQWPDFPPIKSTPRFLTEHPRYKWLNRLQCIGVGEVQMSERLVIYDLYAL